MATQGASGPAAAEHDDILTSEEAARLSKVSARTTGEVAGPGAGSLREYPRQGGWAPIRFRRSDILEWLRQRVVKAQRNGDQAA
jgi:hypothetical protein